MTEKEISNRYNLNIGNTKKIFNLSLKLESQRLEGTTRVTSKNADKIRKELEKIDKKDSLLNARVRRSFIYDTQQGVDDDYLLELLFKRGGFMTYKMPLSDTIPSYVISHLAQNRYTSTLLLELTNTGVPEKQLDRVASASSAGNIELNIDGSSITPYSLVVELSKLRYIIDDIHLYNLAGTPKEQYNYYSKIRDAVSDWKMFTIVYCKDESTYNEIKKYAESDYKKGKSRSAW